MTGEPRCFGSCGFIHNEESRAVPSTTRDRLEGQVNCGKPRSDIGRDAHPPRGGQAHSTRGLSLSYPRHLAERIHVSPNFYVIGSMNVADRFRPRSGSPLLGRLRGRTCVLPLPLVLALVVFPVLLGTGFTPDLTFDSGIGTVFAFARFLGDFS